MNQAWHVWKDDNTMLAIFLRQKYYHTSDFLHTLSSTSSHCWKALIRGQNLMQRGLRWVVRTGQNINF